MMKLVLFVGIAVFVSACRSAESIPAGSKVSDYAGDQTPKTNGTSKFGSNDKATKVSDEERAGLPPNVDSYLASSSSQRWMAHEHLPATMEVPNSLFQPHATDDEAFKQWMGVLGINMEKADKLASKLTNKKPFEGYDVDRIKLMVLGRMIFKRHGKPDYDLELKREPMDYLEGGDFDRKKIYDIWKNNHKEFRVKSEKSQGLMRWLKRIMDNQDIMIRSDELADMVFGIKLLKKEGINVPISRPKVTPQQGVPTPPSKKRSDPSQHNHGNEHELDGDDRVVKKLKRTQN